MVEIGGNVVERYLSTAEPVSNVALATEFLFWSLDFTVKIILDYLQLTSTV